MSKSTRDKVCFAPFISIVWLVGLYRKVIAPATTGIILKITTMVNIIHRIGIRSGLQPVYKALSTIEGIAGWWTEETEGDEQVGGHIRFTFHATSGEVKGQMLMEVKELDPDKTVTWQCVEGP